MRELQTAFATSRSVLVTVMIFSAAINALMFVTPLYMLQIYDRVLNSRSEMTLLVLTLLAVGLLGVFGVLEWLRSRILVRAGLQFDADIAGPAFRRVTSSILVTPQSKPEFALADIDRLREFLTGAGLVAICDVPWVPVFLAVCFVFHPLIGWVATAGALIVLILAIVNEVVSRDVLSEASNASRDASQFVSTSLQNAEVMRAMGMEGALLRRWRHLRLQMLERQATASDRAGIIYALSRFTRMVLQIAILGVGAYLVLEGQLSAGVMIAASIMVGRALAPVDVVVSQWRQFVGARQAYHRLKELFETVSGPDERTALPSPKGELAVSDLIVAPPGTNQPILRGVSFSVSPGEILSIAGPSGSGKSSLLRSLVGVWPTLAGEVRIDGSDIRHWDREDLGKSIGYLPQSVELFSGTIAENIARFSGASSEAVIAAARMAVVHELIQGMPDGYDTDVGPGGRQMSGGQRQRIGLARALFGDPAIIVLDEPNANLDLEGEEALVRALRKLRDAGRTIVFVSHKMGLLALSDKTVVLAEGGMRAFGPTQELLRPRPEANQIRAGTPPSTASSS